MQTQFQYIIDLAKQYNGYSEKPNTLFEAINNLPKTSVEDIFKEYGDHNDHTDSCQRIHFVMLADKLANRKF